MSTTIYCQNLVIRIDIVVTRRKSQILIFLSNHAIISVQNYAISMKERWCLYGDWFTINCVIPDATRFSKG